MAYTEKRFHLAHMSPWGESCRQLEDSITPSDLYVSRRTFIAGVGMVAAASLLAGCTRQGSGTATTATAFCDDAKSSALADELGDKLTICRDITSYNNFYEFSYNKEDVAVLSRNFRTSPWVVTVGGLVENPGSFSIDELIRKYRPEERVYRMRCVEAWSMVIPWTCFPLSRLLNEARPKPQAKFVRFLSLYDAKQMPGDSSLPFPYFEGLRLDEAMHELTVLATGLYGKDLPPQDGAPIRLVVPWKYGFKSAKSILSIDLTADMPDTFWSTLSPDEYGFYANVNPNAPHPRWSQASERRIGEFTRRETRLFNGYSQVAPMYEGMDLIRYF